MEEAKTAAAKIAEKSMLPTIAVKEAVNRSYETTLREGLLFEKPSVPFAFRDRRPERRHGRLSGETHAQFRDR